MLGQIKKPWVELIKKKKNMKINQVYWDNFRGFLRIYMDNNRYLLIVFKQDNIFRGRHKYLTIRDIIRVSGRLLLDKDIECPRSNYLPIRDLQKFMRKLFKLYNGDIDDLARKWFDEEKKTTKD